MRRKEEDLIRLSHMFTAAREALEYAASRTRSELETDRQLYHCLVRCLEIVGEAANNISAEFKKAWPNIPWVQLIRLRHHVVDTCFDINLDIVWGTVTKDLPLMVQEIEPIRVAEGMIQPKTGP